MKVLLIHTGSVAEIVFATPLIRVLKTHGDSVQLYCITSAEGANVLAENPYLDGIYHHVSLLKKNVGRRFDYILDCDSTFTSRIQSYSLKGKVFRFDKAILQRWLATRLKINKLSGEHLTDQYVALASALGIKGDSLRLDYFIPFKDEVPLSWLPEGFQKNYVVFCINASYNTRMLPVRRIIELCDKINKPVILLGDKSDAARGEEIERFFQKNTDVPEFEEGLRELNKKTVVYNACGKFNMHQQASLVKQARYVFTFDNAFIAIASAFGKEVYTLWGNTVLDFGRYPYHTKFTVLENNKLSCRPCSYTGYARCPLKHFKCMNEIVFDFYLP